MYRVEQTRAMVLQKHAPPGSSIPSMPAITLYNQDSCFMGFTGVTSGKDDRSLSNARSKTCSIGTMNELSDL